MESSKGFFRGSFEGKKECQCFFVCLEFLQLAEAEGQLEFLFHPQLFQISSPSSPLGGILFWTICFCFFERKSSWEESVQMTGSFAEALRGHEERQKSPDIAFIPWYSTLCLHFTLLYTCLYTKHTHRHTISDNQFECGVGIKCI